MVGFQSAHKAGHSCETALLRVYNDIITTIGKGNGSHIVLLDLSAAFDTIDHRILFELLKKIVGITANVLQLIKSYFSDSTQRVVIDRILSDIASLVYSGVVANKQELDRSKILVWYYFQNVSIKTQLHNVNL